MAKYRNTKTIIDGITFDSKKEAARWQELKLLERGGIISHLERQKAFKLIEGVKIINERRTRPAIRYFADFFYFDKVKNNFICEDVKSKATSKLAAFRMKQHLMKVIHNIDIILT